MPMIFPFLLSCVTAGVFLIIGLGFMLSRVLGVKRGLFFPFVTGMLALPETVAMGGCLFYHFMYNYNDYVYRTKFMV